MDFARRYGGLFFGIGLPPPIASLPVRTIQPSWKFWSGNCQGGHLARMLLRAQSSANRGFLDVAMREGKFEGLAGPDKAEETGGGGIG